MEDAKPILTLAADDTPESVAAVFEALTGRKPTEEEMVEVRKELEPSPGSPFGV